MEPSDDLIRDTLEALQGRARGATAVTVAEPGAVRPMMEVRDAIGIDTYI